MYSRYLITVVQYCGTAHYAVTAFAVPPATGGSHFKRAATALGQELQSLWPKLQSSAEPRAAWLRMQLTALARAAIDIVV